MALVRSIRFRDDAITGGNHNFPAGIRRSKASREDRMIAALEQQRSTESVGTDLAVASLEGVNKNYGEVRALRGVNFQVRGVAKNDAKKTTGWTILLILLGVAALFGGVKSLFLLIPAAILVWYAAGPAPRRGRN